MKSKEEILDQYHWFSENYGLTILDSEDAKKAMQEYADQQTEELRDALGRLIDAIPGQNNDQDWWPDELTKAVKSANELLNKTP